MHKDCLLTGLAGYLVRDGLLEAEAGKAALANAQQQACSLTSYLVKSQLLSSAALVDYCATQFGLPVFDLHHYDAASLRQPLIHPELICRYRVIPLKRDQDSLLLGITDPTDNATLTAVSFQAGVKVKPVLVAEADMDKIITLHYRPTLLGAQLESALSKITPAEEPESPAENTEQNDEPVIEFVDRLLADAVEKRVSDIHIEPYDKLCRIRFRRDGLLYEATTTPAHLAPRIITRIKVMANLNIAERRLPQDGRLPLQKEKIDVRVNTCPTLFGEKIVLRLLDASRIQLDLPALGLTEPQQALFLAKLMQPQGLILVTGPTGSGKTITLYSALRYLNQIEKNISTVEEPVEIELAGINQVNVNTRIGLDFASVLRAFLRQDPDIIMLGEIRDTDTATIAMQAAETGHLVLSTLHTNSALEAITRLQSMGVATYHLISSLSLILAQRLMRKLCSHCKQPHTLPALFDYTPVYQASGCDDCHQGYKGRTGIFELVPMTEKLAALMLEKVGKSHLLQQLQQEGIPLLSDAAMQKVKQGITSYAELKRVIGHDTTAC